MKHRVDGRKLTDYVMGELNSQETREIERLLEESAEAREEVEEIRQATTFLSESFAQEPDSVLTAEQRESIQEKAPKPKRTRILVYRLAGGLVAACLMCAVYLNWPEKVLEEAQVPIVQLQPTPSSNLSHPADETAAPASSVERSAEVHTVTVTGNDPRNVVEKTTDSKAPRSEKPDSTIQPVDKVGRIASKDGLESGRNQRDAQASRQILKLEPTQFSAPAETQRYELAEMGRSKVAVAEQTRFRGSVVGGVSRGVAVPVIGSIAADLPPVTPPPDFNTEAYDRIDENNFIRVSERPLSTFSIDVDTASYANVRRFLNQRQLPPKDAVRIEELLNYFDYEYAAPEGEHPFAAHMETAEAPWNDEHLLVRFGLKGKEIDLSRRQPGNFVFLIDVSGSMQPANKLPLLKQALRLMVDNLNEQDRVAMAVYAGASGLVLPPTACSEKEKILQALERLEAGGSTNGGAGIELAYRVAEENLLKNGINRVILATDGDFNIGVTNQGDLTRLIEEKAASGVFLTVLGFGMGNYKDTTLEKLADRGNGNYSYIDTLQEARKVLVEEIGGTLVTIAKDVKIQVEFNPAEVQAYRLIGYENRLLRDQDFNDDAKDAGEIGAGHTVTVLYEVVPNGVEIDLSPSVDRLKYQQPSTRTDDSQGELLTLKLRYKEPDGVKSRLIQVPLKSSRNLFETASGDFRFAASVAGFGMLLRDSSFKGNLNLDRVLELAESSTGTDPHGYRKEFISLVKKARAIEDLEELEH